MSNATLNRKAFKGEFKTSIEEGIVKSYKELYPNNDIQIKYESNQNEWSFKVYVTNFPILDKNKVRKRSVFLISYDNEDAIDFSSLPKDDYNKEYNDYSFDNYTWLKEQVENLAVFYKLQGVDITNFNISNYRYDITIYPSGHDPNVYDGSMEYINGSFDIVPISKGTAKSVLSKIKRAAKTVIENKR